MFGSIPWSEKQKLLIFTSLTLEILKGGAFLSTSNGALQEMRIINKFHIRDVLLKYFFLTQISYVGVSYFILYLC